MKNLTTQSMQLPLLRPQSAAPLSRPPDLQLPEHQPRPQQPPDHLRPWTTQHRPRRDHTAPRVLLRGVDQGQRRPHNRPADRKGGRPGGAREAGRGGEQASFPGFSKAVYDEAGYGAGVAERQRRRRKHATLETWLAGSPHDSDEYNTDLEDARASEDAKPRVNHDASGIAKYEEQCKKHGLIPISYIKRHLNKKTLRLRHRYFGGRAARTLASAFKSNTITETLDLEDNYLQSTGAGWLATMLRENTFIVTLNLSNNFIGSRGCKALAEMLDVNTTLKTLILSGNQLKDNDARYFIEALRNNSSLTCLDLSHNHLSDAAGVHLATALSENEGINDLDLSWNSIRGEGAIALVGCLTDNKVLEVLDMSWNGIGLDGATELQLSLPSNTTLKVLDLSNNRIDTGSAASLASGLKRNAGLETLILNLNPLCDSGIENILNAAAVHPSLRFISLENCGELGLSETNKRHIEELQTDKHIIILHGGSGGYTRSSSLLSCLEYLKNFGIEHESVLETAFQQKDKDHTGVLTTEEVKHSLRTAGVRLTAKQLDSILAEIDFSHSQKINYREILSGAVLSEYKRRRPFYSYGQTAI